MNIANKLTILRIVLALVCVGFILYNTIFSLISALFIFILASCTDYLDGRLARKYNQVSDLGKLLDPIADKILIVGVFCAFLQLRIINVWMLVAIMLREFIITGLRLLVLNRGVILEAEKFGKHKTVSQVVGIFIIFFILILAHQFPCNSIVQLLYGYVITVVMWYIVIITIFSGVYYLWANRKLIKTF